MDSTVLRKLGIGFVAGAIAVVTVHEIIDYILHVAVGFPRVPWSMQPAAVTGVPQIVSDVFWGGLWGILFVLVSDKHSWRQPDGQRIDLRHCRTRHPRRVHSRAADHGAVPCCFSVST